MAQTQALLVIDMQNDFCLPSSPLCVAGAQDCLPLVKEAVELARQKQVPVVWVIREHEPTGKPLQAACQCCMP